MVLEMEWMTWHHSRELTDALNMLNSAETMVQTCTCILEVRDVVLR